MMHTNTIDAIPSSDNRNARLPLRTGPASRPYEPVVADWTLREAMAWYLEPVDEMFAILEDCPQVEAFHLVVAKAQRYRDLFVETYERFMCVNCWTQLGWASGTLCEPADLKAQRELRRWYSIYWKLRWDKEKEKIRPYDANLHISKINVVEVADMMKELRRAYVAGPELEMLPGTDNSRAQRSNDSSDELRPTAGDLRDEVGMSRDTFRRIRLAATLPSAKGGAARTRRYSRVDVDRLIHAVLAGTFMDRPAIARKWAKWSTDPSG